MATALAGVSSSPNTVVAKEDSTKAQTLKSPCLNYPWNNANYNFKGGKMCFQTMAAPESISNKVTESITNAQEVCADNPISGECAAAWDEVEEVSAAASDIRLKQNKVDSDPLETYCNDNPETDECRTYED